MRNRYYVVLIGVLSVVIVVGAITGDPSPRDRAEAIGARIMCPVCQGSAIAGSPSATAMDMMDKVDQLIADGMTDDQILRYFSDRYGENIILDPAFGGKTLLLWLLPVAALGVGVWMILRRKRTIAPSVERPQ